MSGLPYDGTPPPEEQVKLVTEQVDEPSALDMALDDYVPAEQAIPEHVQSLMGRMGRGKIYLLEESPAIVHVGTEERVRSNPRTAALAAQLDMHDPSEWLVAATASSPSPIRNNALFVRSDLIQHLSTAKVFSWVTSLGASAMGEFDHIDNDKELTTGVEWLNDETLIILFSTPASALLGLSLIAKAGFDPAEGDDPLLERAAHSIPIHLLPQADVEDIGRAPEKPTGESAEPMDTEGVRRRGRGKFAGDTGGRFDLPALAFGSETNKYNVAEGIDPNARVTIRYATEGDGALRKQAKESGWYKRHGRHAGKERASERREVRDRYEERPSLSWQDRGGGEGRDFAKRLGRERRDPYARPSRRDRDHDRGRRTAEDMDRELDGMARSRAAGEDFDMDSGRDRDRDRDRGDRRPRRREPKGKEDLDKELDDLFAARTSAPS